MMNASCMIGKYFSQTRAVDLAVDHIKMSPELTEAYLIMLDRNEDKVDHSVLSASL